MEALPENKKETLKLPRAYISNIIYTMVGQPFQDWANERIEEWNEKVIEDRNMEIEMDAEIADIFRASTAVSWK